MLLCLIEFVGHDSIKCKSQRVDHMSLLNLGFVYLSLHTVDR
uniref:Uncharacterized protein n=1 Tax=Arundo donax TaxID=35708 RepID=A0A0A8YGE4_ARUDO